MSNMEKPRRRTAMRTAAAAVSVLMLATAVIPMRAAAMPKKNREVVEKLYAKSVRIYKGKTLGKWSAHRGYSDLAPDNSEEAFLLAAKCGAFAIEGDVQSSKDGVPYMFHDSTIGAMTDSKGRLEDYKSSEVARMRIDSGNGVGRFSSVRICSFRKYLRICRKYGCFAVIDVKNVKSAKVRRKFVKNMKKILKQEGMFGKCKIISFYWPMVREWRKIDSKISCKLMESRYLTEKDRKAYAKSTAKKPGKLPDGLGGYVCADSPVEVKGTALKYAYKLTKKGPKAVAPSQSAFGK